MTYFAEIKNDKVVRVIVATQKVIDDNYTGKWIETYIDNLTRKQYAGIGMSYDKVKDKFISRKPYPSWSLDINDDWQSPIQRPTDGKMYSWNEKNLTWNALG